MPLNFRDSDGTTRLAGDLLAPGGTTGYVLTQQADGTYAPEAVAASPILSAAVPVTSAQVLACFTTPVELVAAPGAGSGIVVVSFVVETVGATVAYDAAQPVVKSDAGTWGDLSGQLSTDSDLVYVYAAQAVSGATAAFFDDAPVVLTDTTRDPLLGTAALTVTLAYYTFELA